MPEIYHISFTYCLGMVKCIFIRPIYDPLSGMVYYTDLYSILANNLEMLCTDLYHHPLMVRLGVWVLGQMEMEFLLFMQLQHVLETLSLKINFACLGCLHDLVTFCHPLLPLSLVLLINSQYLHILYIYIYTYK